MAKVSSRAPRATGDRRFINDADVQNLLFAYTDRLYHARSLAEICDAALCAICQGLEVERASILRFDEQGKMRFLAARGLSDSYRQAADGHSPWTRGEANAEIICIEDIAKSSESPALISAVLAENIRGLCFIPLAPDDRVIGKFMVYYDRPHRLSERQAELALIIARQLGFAFQNQAARSTSQLLAALVESSDDAIISKTLDGIITSWNHGAERLFGYRAEEMIGQSITRIIPADRQDEERDILAAICRGQRISSYETIRQCKDGKLVDLSLTVSPVFDGDGKIVGASKIARDVSEKLRQAEAQALLLREMNHRVKNIYALTGSLVQLSARSVADVSELAVAVTNRLAALSRAHALTMPPAPEGDLVLDQPQSLQELLHAILAPFEGLTDRQEARVLISGDDKWIAAKLVTPLALVIHELATNAAKYGSLSVPEGQVRLVVEARERETIISWCEAGGPPATEPTTRGFGSQLLEGAARQLGELTRQWARNGLAANLSLKSRNN